MEERSLEDRYRWWKMGLKVISNGKSFHENFETQGILRWVFKPMVFNKDFETHGILRRF